MSATFDTLTAARELEAAGMDRKQADAVVGAIRESRGQFVSIADLSAFETRITATLYCALWIQAAGIIASLHCRSESVPPRTHGTSFRRGTSRPGAFEAMKP